MLPHSNLEAAPIPGLFSTGVGTNGALLISGSVDPHYRLIQSADLAFPGPNALVLNDTGFPIPPWMPNGPNSKWIAPQANQSTGNQPGDYKYRIVFDLTGLEPATAVITGRWSSDNAGADVLLNGVSTGVTYDGNFAAFSALFTINSGFVDGTNTLDFVVNNAPPGINPTGFRAEISGTADLLPPPATAPSITLQPISQTNGIGESATFRVSVYGSRPLSYQWRFNGNNIAAATNSTYVLNGITASHAGAYDVIVSNPFGMATSSAANLTVVFINSRQLGYEGAGPSSRRTGLAITEIMSHPKDRTDGRNLEFIELYNSNPFPEDLSGYRLTGDVNYTFPSNTTIAGNGFVVVATVPADVQTVYGLPNVLGGFTNNLSNADGTVRLRKRSGAIVLEVAYGDAPPWPAAADGAGHSLVLARASYGEGDARAWAASAAMGGSPGAADPVPVGPLENVVINEVLAHTDDPVPDFIELFNAGPVPVDLSGCYLSDERNTNKFRIATGTSIPPLGFIAFDQSELGFALSADGETVYFVNSNQTRVVEAVRFGGQANGVSYGRYPDGAPTFHELAARTPGNTNAPLLIRDLVINEIMYNPLSGLNDDEYVELHNRGASPIDLGGWRFVGGISYTIPANTVIPANGYLVIAANAARMLANYPGLSSANVVGNFNGNLSNGGERLALARPETVLETNATNLAVTTNTFYVVVDEVTYRDGGRWGRWADGGGSSLELIDARTDNRLAANWGDSDETTKAVWTIVEHTGVLDLNHSAVATSDQLQIFLLGAGEALVDDVEVIPSGSANRLANSNFESGINGWVPQGTQRLTAWETNEGFSSARSLHLRASDRGDHVANRIRAPFTSGLGAGLTATIRAKVRWLRGHPEILLRLRGGHLEASGRLAVPLNLGTPGAPNSRALANAGPAIHDVSHRPILPQADQTIRVTARVHDPDGMQTVAVKYRLDPATTLFSVNMADDGSNGDLIAGDGIFTGIIPGQASGTLVAFHIEAADRFGPSVTTQFPSDAPVRECLVRVGESMPAGAFGTYRFWITQASHTFWSNREKMSNEDVDATFLYGTNRVVYNAGAHYSGSSYTAPIYTTPTGALCGYDLNFPDDEPVLGDNHITLDWPIRDDTNQREQLMFWFLEQYGLPNCYRRYVNLFVNGVKRGTIYDDIQQPGTDMIEEWFSDDSDGSLYKTDCWNEFDDAGNRVDPCILNSLEIFASGGTKKVARYRWNWRPRAVQGTANDFSDLFTLIDAVNMQGSSYLPAVAGQADVAHWMRTFAMNDLASFWDAFGNPNAKNTFLYKPEHAGWKLMCFDFDVGLGVFNDPVDAPLFPALNDPTIARMYNTNALVRLYWCALEEGVNGFFQTGPGTRIDAMLDAKYAAFQANGIALNSPAGIKSWIAQRRAFLLTQLNTVAANFNVITTNSFSTNRNLVTLTGTAPVRVHAISVNGISYPILWTSVTGWTLRVPVAAGTNVLNIVGLDRFGSPVPNTARTVTVNFTGADEAPENFVVINEIMYNPLVPEASYLEIFNASTNYAFDLSNWQLNGLGFSFAPGTILSNGQFLVIAKNRKSFALAYGVGIPVLAEFDGQLDDGGETLTLIKPGLTPAQDLVVDRVTYDDDPPWPAAADGQGASLQLIDARQDNNRVSNWSEGSGWQFFSTNGSPGTLLAPRLFLFLDKASDVYIDNISLVVGTVPEAGPNLLSNGDFETALSGAWGAQGSHVQSALSTDIKYAGNSSLHIVATAAGTPATNNSVWQDISVTNQPYTLSYWYLATVATNKLTSRLNSTFRPENTIRIVTFTPGAANSTAAPLLPYPPLWLSEVQPNNVSGISDNHGEIEPWIELHNSASAILPLAGYFLASNYTNLMQWPFPAGATINPGQYVVIWADGESLETSGAHWHTSFRLNPTNGSVALSRLVNGAPQLLDYLNYGDVGTNHSYGSYPDGQNSYRQLFHYSTPATTNNPSVPPLPIRINEWMAANAGAIRDSADGDFDDWFELYNPTTNAIDLAGYTLTDLPGNPTKYAIPAGITIGPRGFLLVWADEEEGQTRTNGDLHVNFRLNADSEAIELYDPGRQLVDSVVFGMQTNNISQGRWPDGQPMPYFFMIMPTPRAPNIILVAAEIRIETITPGQNAVTLSWSAQSGQSYRVQFKTNLSEEAWDDVPGDVIASGVSASKTDSNLGTATQRFYRILQRE